MSADYQLGDDEYLAFLSEGYLVLTPEMAEEQHDFLYRCAADLYARADKLESPTAHLEILGDNLRAQIPEVDQMLQDPVVKGAISSILGDDYILHPHSFCHQSLERDQPFHQDGNLPWNERGHYRSHRPDWLILFYYPQDVHQDNGPTEIIPGTQYWTMDSELDEDKWNSFDALEKDVKTFAKLKDNDERDERLQRSVDEFGVPDLQRQFVHLKKGSVVIGNYDLIHRGSRKDPDVPDRFMYKFYFARTREPLKPAWRHDVVPSFDDVRSEIQPVVRQVWEWSAGQSNQVAADDVETAARLLFDGREDQKVQAAYELGLDSSETAISSLANGIASEAESTRRASAYGLRAAGEAGIKAAVAAAKSERASTRRFAVYALGGVHTATHEEALDTLLSALTDDDILVRSNAAYSLGQISRAPYLASRDILPGLMAKLAPGAEENNTKVALLPRSTVRQSVAYAVMQYTFNQPLGDDEAGDIADVIATEEDRYVKGLLLEGLRFHFRNSPVGGVIENLIGERYLKPPLMEKAEE